MKDYNMIMKEVQRICDAVDLDNILSEMNAEEIVLLYHHLEQFTKYIESQCLFEGDRAASVMLEQKYGEEMIKFYNFIDWYFCKCDNY